MEFWRQVSGQLVIFERSLAKMLRFWSSKLHFWRKSRTKGSFLSFKALFLNEVSQKSFVFDLQSLYFWRKSRRKASFLSFKASILKEESYKSFVFDLQSFIFEGSLAEKLRFWASKLQFWRKSRRKASFLIFKTSFLKEVSQKSFVWQNHLNHTSVDNQITWTSNHLTSNSFESQINWQPTHLNLKSIDNQIIWISNQLTTKSIESQINWQPKSFKSQIRWQPNHLTLNPFESDINWLSNQLNSAHPLPIGSLSLETSATALCGRYVIADIPGTSCWLVLTFECNSWATLTGTIDSTGPSAHPPVTTEEQNTGDELVVGPELRQLVHDSANFFWVRPFLSIQLGCSGKWWKFNLTRFAQACFVLFSN